MNQKKYFIYTFSFNEQYGGVIALHKLCDLINRNGGEAILCPKIRMLEKYGNSLLSKKTWLLNPIKFMMLWGELLIRYVIFKQKKGWNTKLMGIKNILKGDFEDGIIVYSDVVDGNPLGGKKVVRWLMHNPGFFTGKINYGEDELIYRYSEAFGANFTPNTGSKIAKGFLNVSTSPDEFYFDKEAKKIYDSAYCIRKGKGKEIKHDLKNSILIDKMPLEKIADIFRHSKKFISYDPITALSRLALLCHCPSYIVLSDDETPEQYRPDSKKRELFSYDLSDKTHNWEMSYKIAEENKLKKEQNSIESVKQFILDTQRHFSNNNK